MKYYKAHFKSVSKHIDIINLLQIIYKYNSKKLILKKEQYGEVYFMVFEKDQIIFLKTNQIQNLAFCRRRLLPGVFNTINSVKGCILFEVIKRYKDLLGHLFNKALF